MAATTELGKAYVQIIPSAKGISGKITEALGGESASAGQAAGESWAQKLVSTAKKALVAAGIGKLISMSLTEGAALEQALGGVETLYGNAADTIKAYAKDAFRTAGLSANDYMEQSTSFAAALVSSLSGDTAAAAEAANTALTDMADNANKMGTDMEAIQNAYQGFAKGNYTMLDNLMSLAYGRDYALGDTLPVVEPALGLRARAQVTAVRLIYEGASRVLQPVFGNFTMF